MRKIRRIVVHCSATGSNCTAKQIVNFHCAPVAKGGRGWHNPGYHYIVEPDGKTVSTLPEDQIANGARGYNQDSVHVCYIGGLDANGRAADTRTPAQRKALRTLVKRLQAKYGGVVALGHRDLSPDRNRDGRITPEEWIKACPCFDVRSGL